MNAPLKWHGGKHYLATKIIDLMPPHARYCEPYFGGGSVLLAKDPEGVSEFVNDIHNELMNFWNVLGDESLFPGFQRRVESIPFSEILFNQLSASKTQQSDIPRAVDFFVRIRQSRQGLGRDFATPTRRTRRGMNENVSAWLTAVDGLPEVHARLRRVEIRCMKALDFIRELDTPDTCFYVDPPYLHATRSSTGEYEYEMSEHDHMELLATLRDVKGKVLLSGYRSEMYDDTLRSWRRVEFDLPNNASSSASKERKIECVWMNYAEAVAEAMAGRQAP